LSNLPLSVGLDPVIFHIGNERWQGGPGVVVGPEQDQHVAGRDPLPSPRRKTMLVTAWPVNLLVMFPRTIIASVMAVPSMVPAFGNPGPYVIRASDVNISPARDARP